jgi:putative MFS transporter
MGLRGAAMDVSLASGESDHAAVQISMREISARIDAIPQCRPMWQIICLLSFGAFCEIYDTSMTVFLVPGLVSSGVFKQGAAGLFGQSDAATFIAATFSGLWVGTMAFSVISDRWGRLPALKYAMIWYSGATLLMGVQSSALSIDILRFVTGIGMGVQIVAIDCYIAEITPKAWRGRAFAASKAIQYSAVPFGAILALSLLTANPLGFEGWRWLSIVPAVIALIVLIAQRKLPESPRWLAQNGRISEAEAVLDDLERRVLRSGAKPDLAEKTQEEAVLGKLDREISKSAMTRRIVMMSVANFMQAIGYYGFHNWVPTLLQAKGANLSHSLGYSAAIALSFPIAPLIFLMFADKFERKLQVIVGCLCTATFGMAFAQQSSPAMWIVFGVLVTISSNLMGFSIHTYQAEIFPTRTRARAVGFSHSFTRLSTIFSGYIVAYLLQNVGVNGVFMFLDAALVTAALVVGILGPRTRGLAVEQIARGR